MRRTLPIIVDLVAGVAAGVVAVKLLTRVLEIAADRRWRPIP